MGNEYRAKVFKSGNSVALRLPKALGLAEGTEVVLREARHGFSIEPVSPEPKTIDLTGIAGSCPWLKPLGREERPFARSPRPWDDPAWKSLPDLPSA